MKKRLKSSQFKKRKPTRTSLSFLPLFAFCLFLVSCSAHFQPLPQDNGKSEDPGAIIKKISELNPELKTFKGIGRFEFVNGKNIQTARIAYIGADSNKLRIELIDISGRPFISISNDGKFIYLLSHGNGKLYKRTDDENIFSRLCSLEIDSSDIVRILGGQTPILPHKNIVMIRNINGNGDIIILKNGWFGGFEKIYLDKTRTMVNQFEIFSPLSNLLYRAKMENFKLINGNNIPFKITLSNDKGSIIMVRTDRYYTNVPVNEKVFSLAPLNSN